ncbi:FecR family protein [Cupriavidus sp. 30B13]|uniref:FecR family protein n=1 Tax=Cupriavidus sp. 30B13 TaxID=3384241 RepID=UPI003B907308
MPEPSPTPTPDPAAPQAEDRLSPYRQALRERFPSVDEITQAAQARRQRRRRTQAASAAGAALLALAVWIADPAYRSDLVAAAPGQSMSRMLADGSEVQLDGGSTVAVAWHLRSRRLSLEAGEALFRVAHGPREFTVTAGDTRVRDIGTVFDVRLQPGGTRVIVLEGAVEVSAGNQTRRLEANQRVDVPDGGLPSAVFHVDAERATAWRRGKLSFDGLTLAEAVREMQPHAHRPIVIDDARAAALRLSAEFDRDQVDAMLPLLPGILPVTVRTAADGSVHLAARGAP